MQTHEFEMQVWDYYEAHGRHDLPWRVPNDSGTFDPYAIMVSEIMLQQTQVARVIPKYQQFLTLFPSVEVLAEAPLAEVLKAWSGLGYNRRAKFLWQAAQYVRDQFQGVFPQTVGELVQLPGVGKNTAGAIAAYAFDRPVTYVETNIRTVIIHHFFVDQDEVADKEIESLLATIIDDIAREGQPDHTPRTWYWALMDYGTFLKQTVGNVSKRSKTYAKQSKFEGSLRQIRGHVLRLLADAPLTDRQIATKITDERLPLVLAALCQESIISLKEGRYHLGVT